MRLLLGRDADVANAVWKAVSLKPTPYQMAIGVIDDDGRLMGGALFQEWNGYNVELSYYGKGTLTRDVVRGLAKICLQQFNPLRVTVRTARKNHAIRRKLPKFGFQYEGFCPYFYGADRRSNGAMIFGLYREQLERLANGAAQ